MSSENSRNGQHFRATSLPTANKILSTAVSRSLSLSKLAGKPLTPLITDSTSSSATDSPSTPSSPTETTFGDVQFPQLSSAILDISSPISPSVLSPLSSNGGASTVAPSETAGSPSFPLPCWNDRIQPPSLQASIILAYCRFWILSEEEIDIRKRLNGTASDKHSLKLRLFQCLERFTIKEDSLKETLRILKDEEEMLRTQLDSTAEKHSLAQSKARKSESSSTANEHSSTKDLRQVIWSSLEKCIHKRNALLQQLSTIAQSIQCMTQALYQTHVSLQENYTQFSSTGEKTVQGSEEVDGKTSRTKKVNPRGSESIHTKPTYVRSVSNIDEWVLNAVNHLVALRTKESVLEKRLTKILNSREQIYSYFKRITIYRKKLADKASDKSIPPTTNNGDVDRSLSLSSFSTMTPNGTVEVLHLIPFTTKNGKRSAESQLLDSASNQSISPETRFSFKSSPDKLEKETVVLADLSQLAQVNSLVFDHRNRKILLHILEYCEDANVLTERIDEHSQNSLDLNSQIRFYKVANVDDLVSFLILKKIIPTFVDAVELLDLMIRAGLLAVIGWNPNSNFGQASDKPSKHSRNPTSSDLVKGLQPTSRSFRTPSSPVEHHNLAYNPIQSGSISDTRLQYVTVAIIGAATSGDLVVLNKSGWLEKVGRYRSYPRYFVWDTDIRRLSYYHSKRDSNPTRVYWLNKETVIRALDGKYADSSMPTNGGIPSLIQKMPSVFMGKPHEKSKKSGFKTIAPHRKYYFEIIFETVQHGESSIICNADSFQEREEWIRALAVGGCKSIPSARSSNASSDPHDGNLLINQLPTFRSKDSSLNLGQFSSTGQSRLLNEFTMLRSKNRQFLDSLLTQLETKEDNDIGLLGVFNDYDVEDGDADRKPDPSSQIGQTPKSALSESPSDGRIGIDISYDWEEENDEDDAFIDDEDSDIGYESTSASASTDSASSDVSTWNSSSLQDEGTREDRLFYLQIRRDERIRKVNKVLLKLKVYLESDHTAIGRLILSWCKLFRSLYSRNLESSLDSPASHITSHLHSRSQTSIINEPNDSFSFNSSSTSTSSASSAESSQFILQAAVEDIKRFEHQIFLLLTKHFQPEIQSYQVTNSCLYDTTQHSSTFATNSTLSSASTVPHAQNVSQMDTISPSTPPLQFFQAEQFIHGADTNTLLSPLPISSAADLTVPHPISNVSTSPSSIANANRNGNSSDLSVHTNHLSNSASVDEIDGPPSSPRLSLIYGRWLAKERIKDINSVIKACQRVISRYTFHQIHSILFRLYKVAHNPRDTNLQNKIQILRNVDFTTLGLSPELTLPGMFPNRPAGTMESGNGITVFPVSEESRNGHSISSANETAAQPLANPYSHAIQELQTLFITYDPYDKLSCILHVARALCKCVDETKSQQTSSPSSSGSIIINADDLLLLFTYLLLQTIPVPSTCSTTTPSTTSANSNGSVVPESHWFAHLAFMDDFISDKQRCMLRGYYLATITGAVELIITDSLYQRADHQDLNDSLADELNGKQNTSSDEDDDECIVVIQ